MEITIISRYTAKPSSSSLQHLKPHKLSLFDQLTPATYAPIVLFYPNSSLTTNLSQTLVHLKTSLCETLTLYYPFSGRIKNNLYIYDFDAGVPYLEARVNCRLPEFLKLQETQLLNDLLPFLPFRKETDHSDLLPLLACQINVFACGGLAISASVSHKIFDGDTGNAFLKTWASIFRGARDDIVHPDLSQASLFFPPRDPLPQNYLDLMDSLWFKGSNYVSKRFVFDAKSIATLRARSTSENVPKPTRVEILTSFIWKHAMAASRALSSGTSPKTSIVVHAVNMRPRMNSQMRSDTVMIGNLFWWAVAAADASEADAHDLRDLVNIIKESIKGFDSEYLESLQGEDGGFGTISEFCNQLEAMLSSETPDIYAFTSWASVLKQVDFGWGRPFWIGAMGKVGPAFRNLTVFVDRQWDTGIEAWVNLEENQMALLEKDPHFLAFASPNPGISSM
ncbi:putative alcohol O-acetyltransferase [Rosa chinensis]|uniref:Putative alcohol O-acetyltransferase n=1 Tax=Rosa chinensis TaxID=74649 RepID=A0A2P6SJ64_ROSCH|nr:stemmadenine O-acetyltransferase [Rosa chinensis]PRQ58720.1 putative alcohol O-acetyltransferase [Rosa chinensis]